MQCVILAGGLGTRMKEISGELPKALLPVGPRTFIDWQLEWLKLGGVTTAVLAIGHEGKRIEEHLAHQSQLHPERYPKIIFRYDGKELLGTGGAIAKLGNELPPEFLVTYGDSFLFIEGSALMSAHRKSGARATMSIFENENKGDTSNVEMRAGKLVRYDKKNVTPAMKFIDYGMMALNRDWFLSQAAGAKFDLAPVLTAASERGELHAFQATEIFREIGSPAGYKSFCELLSGAKHDLGKLRQLL